MDFVSYNEETPSKEQLKTLPSKPMKTEPTEKKTYGSIYEEEALQIQSRVGDLESIRQRLGISGSKLCQLLKVDPSAWTRWTKHQDRVPPHVWQALEWKLQLLDFELQSKNQHHLDFQQNSHSHLRNFALTKTEDKASTLAHVAENRAYNTTSRSLTSDPYILSSERSEVLELQDKIQTLEHAVRTNKITAVMLGLGSLILAFAIYRLMKG